MKKTIKVKILDLASLLGNNLIVSLHNAHKRGGAFSAKQENNNML